VHPAPTMRIVRLPDHLLRGDSPARQRLGDEFGIQVPMHEFGGEALMRVAGAVYNTPDDYQRLADALIKIIG